MKKIKLRKFLKDSLNQKFRKGQGHRKEKGVHNETPYIHSTNTYRTYKQQCDKFCDWCYEHEYRTPEEALAHVKEYGTYLEEQKESAWTIYTAMCAIAKAFDVRTTDFDGYKPPKRERKNVKRSRGTAKRDAQFSQEKEDNKNLVQFCMATGLRRRELEALVGESLYIEEDGTAYVYVENGKGGKKRLAQIIGTEEEIQAVIDMMKNAGKNRVFSRVHTKLDVHYYRSVYACRFYKMIARKADEIPKTDRYICRKDKAGIVYDKKAMLRVSKNLGHNRLDVIANSYLHNLEDV